MIEIELKRQHNSQSTRDPQNKLTCVEDTSVFAPTGTEFGFDGIRLYQASQAKHKSITKSTILPKTRDPIVDL